MREDAADDLWTSHRTRLSAQIGDRLEVAVRAPDDMPAGLAAGLVAEVNVLVTAAEAMDGRERREVAPDA